MTHRTRTFFSLTALLLICLLVGTRAAAADRPNIVLILSDDQGFTDYGFMGHPAIQTPNLDKLASQSALFRRGYVPTALCRPSLMTLATGLYAHEHLVTGNDPAASDENKAHEKADKKPAKELMISNIDRCASLPRLLSEAGYLTHQSGKWWEGSYQRGGFTEGMTRGYPEKGGRHGDDGLKIGREGMQPVFDFIDKAVEQDKPFFVWYAPLMPHDPHTPPKGLLDKYAALTPSIHVAKYNAMCEWFDQTCGQLLDRLEAKGLSDNTLVIYVCDNGWVQNPANNGYAERSKRSPYEMGTRTPILYRWPGKIKPTDRPELTSSIDFYPTVLAAAGLPVPEGRAGLNLLPYLTEGKAIERDTLFGESFAHDVADVKNPEASLLFRWVIKGDMKLLLTYNGRVGRMVYPPKDFAPQLYDLNADPFETKNLAQEKPGMVKELTALLDDWYMTKTAKHSEQPTP